MSRRSALPLLVAIAATTTPAFARAAHPQTVWDSAELARLQTARSGSHAALAQFLNVFLDGLKARFDASSTYHLPSAHDVGGYAMMTRLMERDTSRAVSELKRLCSASWPSDVNEDDLGVASHIQGAAVGYDVLYDLLDDATRTDCRDRITAAAALFYSGAQNGMWWEDDYLGNHNTVDFASLGLAGQALDGEHADAAAWRQAAAANFQKVKLAWDLIPDGSWHEGIGYLSFGLERPILFFMGEARRGASFDKTALLGGLGRYILHSQSPRHPTVHVTTHGDANWVRPGLMATLRWAARRFQDPYAAEAARRWDLEGRGAEVWRHPDRTLSWAMEYVAFDPGVAPPDMSRVPLDFYAPDQGAAILRSSWSYGTTSPAGDTLVIALKSGVFGGRGNYERLRTCDPPGGYLDFGHDHEDDLGLWIYGLGGWLMPEAVAYNCCTSSTDFHATRWHNTFLVDGQGQLGDDKTVDPRHTSQSCGSTSNPWFYQREATLPLHASTAHYAFARGEGARLYPASLGVQSLTRTVGLSRQGGYAALQDRASFGAARTLTQLFHSLNPGQTSDLGGWIRLDNTSAAGYETPANATALGVRVIAPADYVAAVGSQSSNNFASVDDDGQFGLVRVSPSAAGTSALFLEVLWPTLSSSWAQRPDLQPLDAANPQRGFSAPLPGGASEAWLFNVAGTTTSAGGLALQSSSSGDLGVMMRSADGSVARAALLGQGRLSDQGGGRTLIDSGSKRGALEVSFAGARAELSGAVDEAGAAWPGGAAGVTFYAPVAITEVTLDGSPLSCWSRSGETITILGPPCGEPGSDAGVPGSDGGAPRTCNTATGGGAWSVEPFAEQTGRFTVTFEATPSGAGLDSVVGLASGAGSAYADYACLLKFAQDTGVVVRNGGSYASDATLPYASGTRYQVRMSVDVAAHRYSVFVTPAGAAEIALATDYEFRTEQYGTSILDHWGAVVGSAAGALEICDFAVLDPGADAGQPAHDAGPSATDAQPDGSAAISASDAAGRLPGLPVGSCGCGEAGRGAALALPLVAFASWRRRRRP